MRRICVDVASSYFHNSIHGFLNTPADARYHFAKKSFRFHGATVFDSFTRKPKDFIDYRKLFDYLTKADEIITFNGRICDLIVIEKLIGQREMMDIWKKPHHDLCGWKAYGLRASINQTFPNHALLFDKTEEDRFAQLINANTDEFIASHLANTYRDTKFAFMLFKQYLISGDSDYTFREDWNFDPEE